MENNWPETVDELIEECQMLVNKTDLYELGKHGEPYTGELEPRVDGTEYLAGEWVYGVAMVPAQWVTSVVPRCKRECDQLKDDNDKLRELVNDLYIWFVRGHDWGPYCAGETAIVEERMRELGIEVVE